MTRTLAFLSQTATLLLAILAPIIVLAGTLAVAQTQGTIMGFLFALGGITVLASAAFLAWYEKVRPSLPAE